MKNDTVLISVVTPAYNAAAFLPQTYQCLCQQTYEHWEWVVVDDGSTDETPALLSEWAVKDSRISYYTQKNSGAAKQPRDHAVYESRGTLVLPLDADDTIEDDYLRKMLSRMIEADASIVYPQMVFIDHETRQVTSRLPVTEFDTTRTYSGHELVKATLPEWQIGCNGGLYRKEVWVNMSYPEKHVPIWMYSDEVDERLYLLAAPKVAFADARYFYQCHATSITAQLSPKLFHSLRTSKELLDLTQLYFGTDSEEYHRAQLKLFYTWRSMMKLYTQNYKQLTGADAEIQKSLNMVFSLLDVRHLTKRARIKFLNLCSEYLLFALFCLKYNPLCLVEKLMRRYTPAFYLNHVVRPRLEQATRQKLDKHYQNIPATKPAKPYAVCVFGAQITGGGLADRLRGAVSLYQACKATGREFKLYFTEPFLLENYLQPNSYDWSITDEAMTYNRQQVDVVVAESVLDDADERSQHRQMFTQKLQENPNRQIHFYTNAAFCYQQDFSRDFRELFKPSRRLQEHLERMNQTIGRPYITVSARFCNLLDDFNEEVYSEPLAPEYQERLLTACLNQTESLRQQHPEYAVVICTDSKTFLERARQQNYVYANQGELTHIGNDTHHSYEYYEKVFLDFFAISMAEKAYLLKAPRMHNSGFPYAAALACGKPLHIVSFLP